nr:nucleotidyltransferase substrate binding protein [Thermodesulfobacteriota bacterium]
MAYRFSKLYEGIGKLLRLYLLIQGEEVEELFMRDVINLAEKRGLAINWEQWATMRELRNILTHEYPQEEEEITKTLNKVKK